MLRRESQLELAIQASLQTKHSASLNERTNDADNYLQAKRIAVDPAAMPMFSYNYRTPNYHNYHSASFLVQPYYNYMEHDINYGHERQSMVFTNLILVQVLSRVHTPYQKMMLIRLIHL